MPSACAAARSSSPATGARHAYQIAHELGCNPQTARNDIHTFNHKGLTEALRQGSKNVRIPFIGPSAGSRTGRGLAGAFAPQTQRNFAKDTTLWTLDLAALVSFEEGLTKEQITGQSVRATLIWDNASWHISKEIQRVDRLSQPGSKKQWPRSEDHKLPFAQKEPLAQLSMEPKKWVDGKRKVVEPDGLLRAHELAERVCLVFDCPHYEHLSIAENAA